MGEGEVRKQKQRARWADTGRKGKHNKEGCCAAGQQGCVGECGLIFRIEGWGRVRFQGDKPCHSVLQSCRHWYGRLRTASAIDAHGFVCSVAFWLVKEASDSLIL